MMCAFPPFSITLSAEFWNQECWNPDGSNESNDFDFINMAGLVKDIQAVAISDFLEEKLFQKFIESSSSISTELVSNISCVDYYRR